MSDGEQEEKKAMCTHGNTRKQEMYQPWQERSVFLNGGNGLLDFGFGGINLNVVVNRWEVWTGWANR